MMNGFSGRQGPPLSNQWAGLQPGESVSPQLAAQFSAGQFGPARAGQAGITGVGNPVAQWRGSPAPFQPSVGQMGPGVPQQWMGPQPGEGISPELAAQFAAGHFGPNRAGQAGMTGVAPNNPNIGGGHAQLAQAIQDWRARRAPVQAAY